MRGACENATGTQERPFAVDRKPIRHLKAPENENAARLGRRFWRPVPKPKISSSAQ
jgi:hypothetical protein